MNRLIGMVILGAVATLTGCKTEPCAALYDKMAECAPEMAQAVKQAEFVQACIARPAAEDPGLACVDKSSCVDFTACYQAASQARTAQKQIERITAHVSAEEWKQAAGACSSASESTQALDGYATACKAVWARQYDEAFAGYAARRDKGQRAQCRGIVEMAEKIGGDAPAKTETLCAEVAQAGPVAKLIATGKAARTKGTRPDFIQQCTTALTALESIDSPWAKARTTALATACFLDARGLMVVGIMSTPKPDCSPDLAAVVKGLVKYDLSSAEVAPHLAAAKTLCGVK